MGLPFAREIALGVVLLGTAVVALLPASQSGPSPTLEQRLTALEAEVQTLRQSSPRDVRRFGAVGNGIADDTLAIQKAIDEVYAAGGGTVFIPVGKFRVTGDGLQLRNYVSLEGVDSLASQIVFDQPRPTAFAINLVNRPGEFAPQGQNLRSLRIVTAGGGAVRTQSRPWTDGVARGWHHGGMIDVEIVGGARGRYAIDLPLYCQQVVMENVRFLSFFGPMIRLEGNFNTLRNVGPESWAVAGAFMNPDGLPMMWVSGDTNALENCLVETFRGFAALKLTGHRHRIRHMWAEWDGDVPGTTWILLEDAHHIVFDTPHMLNPGTHRLKMVRSDATIIALEPKHLADSLDLDDQSSLTVLVPATAGPPGVHVPRFEPWQKQ